jgi:hypothetical protein
VVGLVREASLQRRSGVNLILRRLSAQPKPSRNTVSDLWISSRAPPATSPFSVASWSTLRRRVFCVSVSSAPDGARPQMVSRAISRIFLMRI